MSSLLKTLFNSQKIVVGKYIYNLSIGPFNCENNGVGLLSSEYRGTIDKTRFGKKCQNWTIEEPHKHNFTPTKLGEKEAEKQGIADHNYCRDPHSDRFGAWCYTTDEEVKWDYCSCREASVTSTTSIPSTTTSTTPYPSTTPIPSTTSSTTPILTTTTSTTPLPSTTPIPSTTSSTTTIPTTITTTLGSTTTTKRDKLCPEPRIDQETTTTGSCIDLNTAAKRAIYFMKNTKKETAKDSIASVQCIAGYQLNVEGKTKTAAVCVCEDQKCKWIFKKGAVMCVKCAKPNQIRSPKKKAKAIMVANNKLVINVSI